MLVVFPCLIHHGEEAKAEIPQDVQRSPAFMAEGTTEEEMKGYFLCASGTEHTRVVIPFQLVPLSFENVCHIITHFLAKQTTNCKLLGTTDLQLFHTPQYMLSPSYSMSPLSTSLD
jgi:hypothetical protein